MKVLQVIASESAEEKGGSIHTCNTEMCVKHIDHVSRPVCNAARLWVLLPQKNVRTRGTPILGMLDLGRENKPLELLSVEPWHLAEDGERRKNPKTVAHLLVCQCMYELRNGG